MKRKIKSSKPITALSIENANILLSMLDHINSFLELNSKNIDECELHLDSKILNDFQIKIRTKILSCTDKKKCLTFKSIDFYSRYLFVKYSQKGIIKYQHPFVRNVHSMLIPVLQQDFL